MSKYPQDLSQPSLDEFEEIERIIRENTAVDSEEEQDSSAADLTTSKQPVEAEAKGDTGYQSVTRFTNDRETLSSQGMEDGSSASDSENSTTTSSRSRSSLRRTHLAPRSDSSCGDATDKSLSERSFPIDPNFSIPNNYLPVESQDAENGDKLVATFGTTENLEALLKKQLDDDNENGSENGASALSEVEKSSPVSASPEPPPSKVQLPPQWRSLRNRTTRSPAANRARNASKTKSRSLKSHSPGLPESSDDLSVHSDASRYELRQRLRKSRAERDKEQNITQQLQTDYDDLLTKFAEAENVIDQLRIGARIDLFAQLPSGGSLDEPVNMKKPRAGPQSTPRPSQSSVAESSIKLNAAASKEFNRIALEHRATELKDHIEAFDELLKEGHVKDDEKRQVLDNIIAALNQLQADYILAGQERDAENRALILSGNASSVEMEDFDSDSKIKQEIFELGKMVENLKESIQVGPSLPQTPVSSRKFLSSEQPDSDESSNSMLDIDDHFNEQLRRYNKNPVAGAAEGHTTATSHFTSSDEDTVGYADGATPRKTSVLNTSNIIPERFLRPQSASSTSPSKSMTRPASSDAGTSPARSSHSPLKANSSFRSSPEQKGSFHLPKSRLPRPVGTQSHSTPVAPMSRKKPSSTHDMDIDSGFIGSESSRQSGATVPLKHDPRLQKLSPVHSVPHTEPTQPVAAHRKPLKPTSKHSKTSAKLGTTGKGPPAFTKQGIFDDHNSSDTMVPGAEATVYTPTKRILRNRLLRSDDGSTWSSASKPMPAFVREDLPRGTSGDMMFSNAPSQLDPYRHAPTPAEKPRPSSRRSAASSSKDSTLDLLRGEIAKLRQELKENLALAGTPSKHTVPHGLRRTASDSTKTRRGYTSDSQATESPSARGRRATRSKDRRRYSKQNSDTGSVDLRKETAKGRTKMRNAKTGSDTPIAAKSSAENTADSSVLQGHWEYIPPYFSPPVASVRHAPVPAVYSSPVHVQAPVLQMEPSYYSPVRCPSPARIYVPISPSVSAASFKSIPVQTGTYQRRGSIRFSGAATQTPLRADETDEALTRSQLTSTRRSSSVPPIRQSFFNPVLSISLERAERAANSLRIKSRAMNRSLRDSFNGAQLSSTLA